jgi:DNA-binding transcriptional regulator YiaG
VSKYKSEIYEAIHQDAIADYEIGAILEAKMREYDKMCLVPETSNDNNAHETVNIEHADFVTV